MFTLFNKPGHKFANKKFYSIDGVLKAYKEYLKTKKETKYQGLVFNRAVNYLNLVLSVYEKNHDIRCVNCGCKANHFRLINETQGHQALHLFGIKHIKGTKSAEYLFFNRDHICPQSIGGYNGRDNIQLMCEKCNSEKGNSTKNLEKKDIKDMQKKSRAVRIANRFAALMNRIKASVSLGERDRQLLNKVMDYIWKDQHSVTEYLDNNENKK